MAAAVKTEGKMICPECGVAMNHHGDKLVYAAGAEEPVDPALGGSIEEFHTCPDCGGGASRRA